MSGEKCHISGVCSILSSLLHKLSHQNKKNLNSSCGVYNFIWKQACLGFNYGCNLMHSKS